jgi:hypothetical protein
MEQGRLTSTPIALQQNEGCPKGALDEIGVECVHVCDPNVIPK